VRLSHSSIVLALLSAVSAFGSTTPAPAPTSKPPAAKEERFIFDAIPRPFQRRPRLEMTVITEMTDVGKTRPTPSAQSPAYFALHSAGYVSRGDISGEKTVAPSEIEKLLLDSLAQSGLIASSEAHPPELLIIYYWGVHAVIDPDAAAQEPASILRNVFDRAALVGGERFAAQLRKIMQKEAGSADATAPALGVGNDTDSMDLGAAKGAAQMNAIMDPLKLFMQYNRKNEFLVNQATDDCYYVVASAFDYQSIATPNKQLLWRTRMTVSARGIDQADGLPLLIASAAPYFARDMTESVILTKRTSRDGKVEVGTPTVVEPAADPKKK
jgi:hypothetical protein